jgi:predicted MFS family arabinose efflux permease
MMMILYGIQGAYAPAVQASMPLLAEGDMLIRANAVVNLVQMLATTLGSAAGGFLFSEFGMWPILAVSCVCFAFSAFIELFIKIPFKKRPPAKSAFALVKGDMAESGAFVFKEFPIMGRVIAITFMINLVMSAMLIVGLPVIITEILGMSEGYYGVSQSVVGIGGLIGGVLAGVLGKRAKPKSAWLFLGLCALSAVPMGIVLIFSSNFASYAVITAMSAVMMGASTLFSIQMLAFGQAVTPRQLVGKVIALVMTVNLCAQPLGQAVYGLLFERFTAYPWAVVLGSALLSLCVALYSRSVFRKLPAEEEVLGSIETASHP